MLWNIHEIRQFLFSLMLQQVHTRSLTSLSFFLALEDLKKKKNSLDVTEKTQNKLVCPEDFALSQIQITELKYFKGNVYFCFTDNILEKNPEM